MEPIVTFIFYIAIVLFSVVIHEVSHGLMAYALGDPTAKYAGRLTLNPIPHIDLFGSIILPFILAIPAFFGAPTIIFGWAKPVPYNPYNLKNQKWGPALVGAAGPGSNILIALAFSLVVRSLDGALPASLAEILTTIILINILLAIFNLVPIPPLDGSKVLFALLPASFYRLQGFLEEYGFFLFLIFIFLLWRWLLPLVFFIFRIFVGAC